MIFSYLIYLTPIVFAIEPVVHLSKGSIKGSVIEYKSKRFFAFKKVPFAEPPLGKLRFSKPVEIKSWNGILDGSEYGPACMSNTSRTNSPQKWMDEDCLHMNIFTSESCMRSSTKCPIAFYLHGGDIVFDSAVMFNETKMVESFASKDVILVISAFRLGILSHLILSDQTITTPNLALYDIAKGLEFVNKEISYFGGDSHRVTLFGHSYGATIALTLMCAKDFLGINNYYSQVVSMSGSFNYYVDLPTAIRNSYTFSDMVNCSSSSNDQEVIDCLRDKSKEDLLSMERYLEETKNVQFAGLTFAEPLFDTNLPLSHIYKNPRITPILLGTLSTEFCDINKMNIGEIVGFENPKEVDEKYRQDGAENKLGFNFTDRTQIVKLSTRLLANSLSEKNKQTYMYQYLYPKHNLHMDDLSFIMGIHEFDKDENEQILSLVYLQYFIKFIKGEKPAKDWNSTNRYLHSYYAINWNETSGLRPHMENHYEEELMNYWLIEMKEYDRYITQKKLQSPRFRELTIPQSEHYPYQLWLIVLIVFLIGFAVGRYYCNKHFKKADYVTLDGYNYALLYSDVKKPF